MTRRLSTTRRLLPAASLIALLAIGCAPAPPIIGELTLEPNPNPSVPLAARIQLTTNMPSRVAVEIEDGADVRTVTPSPELAIEHDLPILGLKPGRTHTLRVKATSEKGGESVSQDLTFKTPQLPDDFPPFQVRMTRPALREPGITMVPVFRWPPTGPDREYGLIFGLDESGEVVWYYQTDHMPSEPWPLGDGRFGYLAGRDGKLLEIDLMGNVVGHWHARLAQEDQIPEDSVFVDTDTFHHDYQVLPNGNFLVLGSEARQYDDYPSSDEDASAPAKPAWVIGDTLVEFDRQGVIHNEWKLLDIMDSHRLGPNALSTGFWSKVYENVLEEPAYDWAHSNSLTYDPSDHSVVISMNHQSAIFKLDLESSELRWILGDPAGWREPWSEKVLQPVGEVTWPYSQHAAKITPEGHIMLFDNGSQGGIPFHPETREEPRWSRAVIYDVDEESMEVRQIWEHGAQEGEGHYFSSFLSDTDWLPQTGNILITSGAGEISDETTEELGYKDGRLWPQIMEVARGTEGEPDRRVFEMVIDDPTMGWAVYRAHHIPSLYPSGP